MMLANNYDLKTTRFLSLCLLTVLLLMSVFQTGISSVKADVRCYCNLPVCVTSGYMCKSSLGTCISDHFGFSGDMWRSRHACLELVSSKNHDINSLECTDASEEAESVSYPTRLCCHEDMCNYFRNAVEPQNPSYKLNHSYMTGQLSNDDYFYRHGGNSPSDKPSMQHHLWFKAAVIAVPIAGVFILVMLIVMAARMLQADRKRQKQWTELQRRKINTHIVYTDEKATSHGLLYFPKSISSVILSNSSTYHPQVHKNYSSVGNMLPHQNSLYKNVSIAMSTDTACTDSSRDKYFVFDL